MLQLLLQKSKKNYFSNIAFMVEPDGEMHSIIVEGKCRSMALFCALLPV